MSSMNLGWVRQQPTFNTTADDNYPSTTTDPDGNVYVAYMTTGVTIGQTQTGTYDIVVVKLNINGTVLWVTQQPTFNIAPYCQYPSIASDPLGNLYVVYQLPPQRHDRWLIVTFKLDQDGQCLWTIITQNIANMLPMGRFNPTITADRVGNSYTVYYTDRTTEPYVIEESPDTPANDQQLYSGQSAGLYQTYYKDIFIDQFGFYLRAPFGIPVQAQMKIYQVTLSGEVETFSTTINVSNTIYQWVMVSSSGVRAVDTAFVGNSEVHFVITNVTPLVNPLMIIDAYGTAFGSYFPPPDTIALKVIARNANIYVTKMDTDGNTLWIGYETLSDPIDHTPAIAVDTSGNTYATIESSGSVVNLMKFNTSGFSQWVVPSTSFGTGSVNSNPKVAVDLSGNSYLTYQTDGTVSGQTNTGGEDIVVAKFDTDGNVLWLRQQPTFNTTGDDQVPSIALNSSGNGICVTYQTNGVASGQTSLGGTGIVVFQMDSSGNTQWVQQNPLFNAYGGGGSGSLLPSIAQVLVGENNYIYVSYYTNGVTSGQTNTGGDDIVILQLRQFTVYEPVIAYGQDGYLYYAYYTSTAVNLFSDGYDVVVVKMDMDGNVLWSQQNPIFDTRFSDLNPSIVTYGSDVYVVYQTYGQVSGGHSLIPYDIVVMKMNGSGDIVWIIEQPTFNSTRSNEKPVVDVDSSGNLYVAYQSLGIISGGFKTAMIDYYDVVMFKMAPDSTVLWTFQSDVYNNYRGCYNTKIRCDNLNQEICLSMTCDSNAEGQTFCGYSDILVLKVTYDGAIATTLTLQPWVFEQPTFDTFFPDDNSDVCVDGEGNIYVCYCTTGGTVSGQTATGFNDIVLVKFNSQGDVVKTLQNAIFNSSNDNINPSIAYHYGFIYVTLQTNGSVSGRSNVGSYDVVIMKVNVVTFDVMWIQQGTSFDTPLGEASPSITTDPEGNCYVAYQTDGNFPGPYSGSLYSYSGIVVAQLYADGSFGWVSGQL